eukprot:scaffold4.g4625.t1
MRKRAKKEAQRPEVSANAADHYAADGERYSSSQAATQYELAASALAMLALQQGQAALLADVGCGSGLAAAALAEAGARWVGLDVSPAMLALARADPRCAGCTCLADMAQGLPLRTGLLDGTVSISAAQWLFAHAQPAAALARLFAGLHACLRPGARAALQVYLAVRVSAWPAVGRIKLAQLLPRECAAGDHPRTRPSPWLREAAGEEHSEAMLAAARAAGFLAAFCVTFPHVTPAKKYTVCLHKLLATPAAAPLATQQAAGWAHGRAPAAALARSCCLAWPRQGTCGLAWERHLRECGLATGGLAPAVQRLQRQHCTAGKHVLRLHRRAESLLLAGVGAHTGIAPDVATAAGQPAGQAQAQEQQAARAGEPNSPPEMVLIEAEVVEELLQPCGGPVFVQLAAPRRWLEQREGGKPDAGDGAAERTAGAAAAAGGWAAQGLGAGTQPHEAAGQSAGPHSVLEPRVAGWGDVASILLGRDSSVLQTRAKLLDAEAACLALLRLRQQPYPATSAPVAAAAGGTTAGSPERQAEQVQQAGEALQRRRSYMWIEPLPLGPPARLGAGLARAGVLHAQKSAQHLILSCWAPSLADAAAQAGPQLRALCHRLDGSLVAADAVVGRGRGAGGGGGAPCHVTWLLFVCGLQQVDRQELVAHVRAAFSGEQM